MERQHTPGPWTLGDPAHEHTSGRAWTVPVWANEAPSGDKIAGEATATSRETARANARLIASAPDLLEALEAIIDYAESDIADRRRLIDSDEAAAEVEAAERNMAAARAAIAKAGGAA